MYLDKKNCKIIISFKMDKVKELLADPAKLEATIKDSWTKIDTKNEGEVQFDTFKTCCEQIAKEMGITEMLPTTDKGKEEFKQITDPNNTGKVNFEGFKKIVQTGIDNMKKKENDLKAPPKSELPPLTNVYIASKNLSDYMKKALEAANYKPTTKLTAGEGTTPNLFIAGAEDLSKLTDEEITLAIKTCVEGQTFVIDRPTVSDLFKFMVHFGEYLSKEKNSYYGHLIDTHPYSFAKIFNQFPEAEYKKEDKSKKLFEVIANRKKQAYFVNDIKEVLEFKEIIGDISESENKDVTEQKKVEDTYQDDKSSAKPVDVPIDFTKITHESATVFGQWLNSKEKEPVLLAGNAHLGAGIDDLKKAESFNYQFTATYSSSGDHYDGRYNGRAEVCKINIDVWAASDIDRKKDYYLVRTSVTCPNKELNYQNQWESGKYAGPYFKYCTITSGLGDVHSSLRANDCSPQTSIGSSSFTSGMSFNIGGNIGFNMSGPTGGISEGFTISESRTQSIPDISISLNCADNKPTWTFNSPDVEPYWKGFVTKYDSAKSIQTNTAIFDTYALYTMDSCKYWIERYVPLSTTVKVQINSLTGWLHGFLNTKLSWRIMGLITNRNFTTNIKKPCNSYCNYIMYFEAPEETTPKNIETFNNALKEYFPNWGNNVRYYGFCDTHSIEPSKTNGSIDNVAKEYFKNTKDIIIGNQEVLKSRGFKGKFKFIIRNSETSTNVDSFEITF